VAELIFRISEFGLRDMVNLVDGAKMGSIKDVHINLETGQVEALVLSGGKRLLGLFSAGKDIVIPWEKVKKIGIDTVLVEIE
jgi:YlmC/YmxH family sporulation protein